MWYVSHQVSVRLGHQLLNFLMALLLKTLCNVYSHFRCMSAGQYHFLKLRSFVECLEVKLAEKAEYVLEGWNKNQLFFQNTKWYLVLG